MDSSAKVLTTFEHAFLLRLLSSIPGLYLSGGAALAVHLGHRRSLDLDLFAADDAAFQAARASLPVVASELGARTEILTDSPAFRRVLLTGPHGETLRVDLVRETGDRAGPPPGETGGLRIDPPEEIVVNKLCAILGRSEPRDLVDLFFLDQAGYPPLAALDNARRKDSGLTPGLLAWAITQVPLDRLPEGLLAPVSLDELRGFRARLVEALERLSFPE
jgi:Nucleotidyl transferase AbiEii toxin, Type IV TA system